VSSRLALSVAAILAILGALAAPAFAKDPGQEAYMVRMLACEGPDARMEVYLPQSSVFGEDTRRAAKTAQAPAQATAP